MKNISVCVVLALSICISVSCSGGKIVSHENFQKLNAAEGSPLFGYSGESLGKATRLSKVKMICGSPMAEWDEDIPMFEKVKNLKYRTYDPNGNVLTAKLIFLASPKKYPDPILIKIKYLESEE